VPNLRELAMISRLVFLFFLRVEILAFNFNPRRRFHEVLKPTIHRSEFKLDIPTSKNNGNNHETKHPKVKAHVKVKILLP
jgi:hypothetical protein